MAVGIVKQCLLLALVWISALLLMAFYVVPMGIVAYGLLRNLLGLG